MRSLLALLCAGLVVSLVLVFGVQWSIMRGAMEGAMREFIAAELAQDADELFGALVPQPGGGTSLSLAHFDPAFLSPGSGRYYQISVDGAVALRSPSLVYDALPAVAVARSTRSTRDVAGPNGQSLMLVASGYQLGERAVTIAVAADLASVDAQSRQLLARYTEASLAMFVLLVVLQVVIVRLALGPLRRVEGDVARL